MREGQCHHPPFTGETLGNQAKAALSRQPPWQKHSLHPFQLSGPLWAGYTLATHDHTVSPEAPSSLAGHLCPEVNGERVPADHRCSSHSGQTTWKPRVSFPLPAQPPPSSFLEAAVRVGVTGPGNCLEAGETLRTHSGSVRPPGSLRRGSHRSACCSTREPFGEEETEAQTGSAIGRCPRP